MRGLAVAVAALAAQALAQTAGPGVAPFPLEVTRPSNLTEKQRDTLQATYKVLLRRAGVVVPDGAKLAGALKELKRGDCDREDACLAQLAKLSGALYGLYAAVDLTADGTVVAAGRVVRDDGKLMGEVGQKKQVKLPKGAAPFEDVAGAALAQLMTELKVGELPAVREVAAANGVKPPDGPDGGVPPGVEPGASSMGKVLGWTVAGVGGAAALAGGVLFGVGAGTPIEKAPQGYVYERSLGAYDSARSSQSTGVVLLIAGLAVCAGGLTWAALSSGAEPAAGATSVGVAPAPGGGAMFFVGGSLP